MEFEKNITLPLLRSLTANETNNALCIEGRFYTYRELATAIAKIRRKLHKVAETHIGLVANNDLETYASIFALWLEGKCYVPLHPGQPLQRCMDIIGQVGIHVVLDSSEATRYHEQNVMMTAQMEGDTPTMDAPKPCTDEETAYILFTSGSTGRPKGVPISRGNLAAFVDSFYQLGFRLNASDRCLQMFDLTFDLSVQSYLLPLLNGACAYTVDPTMIKYQAVFELLDEYHLTFALMVPSVIHYLRPYMDEIQADEMRYSLFCGEALNMSDTDQWSRCVPNAEIWNVYGPTECTIYCTAYQYKRGKENKGANGIMGIGHAMSRVKTVIADDNGNICKTGEKGELCLAGNQLTQGYWKNDEKNQEAFFHIQGERFYKTGDICQMDKDGDILYAGRKDSQVKIQGYRIELSEIECVARKFYDDKHAVVALPIYDEARNCTIHLVVEDSDKGKASALTDYLKNFLPAYMMPTEIHYMEPFPLNANNKIDRKKIAQSIK